MRWIVLLLVLSGCGLFQKSVNKASASRKSETIDKSRIETYQVESKDLSTVDLVRLRIRKTPKSDPNDTTVKQALITAVQGATDLEAIISRETLESLSDAKKRSENRDIEGRQENKQKNKDLEKQSDTTWTANFPPWVIIVVAAMVIGAVFLYFKLRP